MRSKTAIVVFIIVLIGMQLMFWLGRWSAKPVEQPDAMETTVERNLPPIQDGWERQYSSDGGTVIDIQTPWDAEQQRNRQK